MGAKTIVSPRTRLAAARWLSLILFAWAFVDDSWHDVFLQYPTWQFGGSVPFGILFIAGISLLTLTVLCPVLLRGRVAEKLLAVLLAIFPLLMFVIAATWVFSCPGWGIIVLANPQ